MFTDKVNKNEKRERERRPWLAQSTGSSLRVLVEILEMTLYLVFSSVSLNPLQQIQIFSQSHCILQVFSLHYTIYQYLFHEIFFPVLFKSIVMQHVFPKDNIACVF